MKAVGIIRRIDDLGRVVIPREIRQNLGIREGNPLEFYVDNKSTLCLRKYEVSLHDRIKHLENQIEEFCNLPHETQVRIKTLLDAVRELVKSEE